MTTTLALGKSWYDGYGCIIEFQWFALSVTWYPSTYQEENLVHSIPIYVTLHWWYIFYELRRLE